MKKPDIKAFALKLEEEFDFEGYSLALGNWIAATVSPFAGDTVDIQRARIDRARTDLLYFVESYLPHYCTKPFGQIHREWANLLKLRDEVMVISAPREHAKSTIITLASNLQDALYKIFYLIGIGSDTKTQATKLSLDIRLELERNPRIIHDFGDQIGFPWKKDEFVLANGVMLFAFSRGENPRGIKHGPHRLGKVVIDDWDNRKRIKNQAYVKEGLDFLKSDVIGSMGDDFLFVMVGNRISKKSGIAKMQDDIDENGDIRYTVRRYKAIEGYDTPDARLLWPEGWTTSKLMAKLRAMGQTIFGQEFLDLDDSEGGHFPEKWFRYYAPRDLDGLELETVTFVDPSSKSKEINDFRAVVTVSLHRATMVYYVRRAWIKHASLTAMFTEIGYQHESFGSKKIGIEDNVYGEFLTVAITFFSQHAGRILPWLPVYHSTNKEARIIGTLQHLVQFAKLLFVKGDSDQDLLVQQLQQLDDPSVHDDGPDALEGAVDMMGKPKPSSGGKDPESQQERGKLVDQFRLPTMKNIREKMGKFRIWQR